jgi:hypothetical protein
MVPALKQLVQMDEYGVDLQTSGNLLQTSSTGLLDGTLIALKEQDIELAMSVGRWIFSAIFTPSGMESGV